MSDSNDPDERSETPTAIPEHGKARIRFSHEPSDREGAIAGIEGEVWNAMHHVKEAMQIAKQQDMAEPRWLLSAALMTLDRAWMWPDESEASRDGMQQRLMGLVDEFGKLCSYAGWAMREAARSTLESALREAIQEWQPIESAPKDGTDILLSNGVVVSEGHWLHQEGYIRERRDLDGRYIDQDESEGFDGWIDWFGGMRPEPTHWMHLPAPPREGSLPDRAETEGLRAEGIEPGHEVTRTKGSGE